MLMRRIQRISYKRLFEIFFLLLVLIGFTSFSYLFMLKHENDNDFTVSNSGSNIEKNGDGNNSDIRDDYLSLIMVGDSLIHEAVYADAKTSNGFDFRPMFQYVKPIICKYDLAFYNQESILGGKEIGLSTYPRFNSPYEVGDAFLDMGFNIVSLANNHTLDRGIEAIVNSRSYWNSKNVLVNGSAALENERYNYQIMEKNNIKYTMLAYTDYTNGLSTNGKDYLVNRIDFDKIKKDIEAVRDKVDVLMVSVHFGEEYNLNVTNRQKEVAQFLADNGVDIVIGHHPHVVGKIDYIGDTLVVYSLGNFISAQRGVERLTGLMTSVVIHKHTEDGNSKISLENTAAELVYTHTDYINGGRHNFRIYPYSMLNDNLLNGYRDYYDKYMGIVVSDNSMIEKR